VKAVNGAAHTIARKSVAKKAASAAAAGAATLAGSGNGAARTGKAAAPAPASRKRAAANGAGAKLPAAKGEGASVQALVRDPQHEGEVVRKSRAITPEAAVPVQIGGLKPEVTRPAYWDKACADLVKRDRILKKLIPKFGPVHLINRDDPFTTLARCGRPADFRAGRAEHLGARRVRVRETRTAAVHQARS
jgi:DNA-3-methyladenine glycosylase II